MEFVDLKAQYQKYKLEIDAEIHDVLDSSQYIMGKKVTELENNLANYVGANQAIACSSGTDALLLALMALDLNVGDEIITTPFTFIATAEVIVLLKLQPVFVDIEPDTYNIDVNKVEEKITKKTKVIMPVGIFGQPADMDAINKIALKYHLTVIEDAAQSFGSEYKNKKSCNLSSIGCTSFFPAKVLGGYGDGGAILCSDENLALKMRHILNHGQTERYVHKYIGINGRLDAIQAAIINVKLKYFDEEITQRNLIAQRYNEGLSANDKLITPLVKSDRKSVYAQYSIRVKNNKRKNIIEHLSSKGIPTAIHYPIPLHLQEVFAYLNYAVGDFPITEAVSNEIMSLPMSAFLTESDQNYIIEQVNYE